MFRLKMTPQKIRKKQKKVFRFRNRHILLWETTRWPLDVKNYPRHSIGIGICSFRPFLFLIRITISESIHGEPGRSLWTQ